MDPRTALNTLNTHARGARYERIAASHLERRGWTVLERNVRFGRKEIDLVVRRGRVVAFVEVKGRRGARRGDALEAVTWRKRREIETVALWWVARASGREGPAGPGETPAYRFDVVAVREDDRGAATVEHVEDAWRPGWR